jgi:tryptophan synthase beta chain
VLQNGAVTVTVKPSEGIEFPSGHEPDEHGHFGRYGGRFVPEALIAALDELSAAYDKARGDREFLDQLDRLHRDYTGRPSPLTDAEKLGEHAGGRRILLKREDLNHTGSHKINNVLGQALLTKRMGKTRVIAETGAGQHGVATATGLRAARAGVRRLHGRGRHRAAGAERGPHAAARRRGDPGDRGLPHPQGRDQRGAARLGVLGRQHPLPARHGRGPAPVPDDGARLPPRRRHGGPRAGAGAHRAAARRRGGLRRRRLQRDRHLPRVPRRRRRAAGRLRAGGDGVETGRHGATLSEGSPGALHGAMSYLLQDEDGQTAESYSISAGLDYPGVGPEHALLKDLGRATYEPVTDAEAMDAFALLCRTEGIIPAIESAHAIAGALRLGRELGPEAVILVNLSGRGDKDVDTARKWFKL